MILVSFSAYATEIQIRVMSNPAEEDGEEDELEEDGEEDEVELNCTENDALEFDDFAYFPSSPPPSSSPTNRECDTEKEKSFLPQIVVEKRLVGNSKEEDLDRIGEERLMGPSLPEIINRNAERRRERSRYERVMFGGEETGGSPTTVLKRDREDHRHPRGQASDKQEQVHLPDIKLLESDLKMMGLDVILNDSDDSFERAIKRHFRNESKAGSSSTSMFRSSAAGECLLRSGNEELKKKKQVDDNADWLIQLDVELENPKVKDELKKNKANRCAKCNKKLGIIMIMQCTCGLFFCPQHRYAEAHNCAYDFKGNGKQILAKENPLVVGEKLPKI